MVRAVAIRDPEKARRIVNSLRRLCDRWRDDLLPTEFYVPGTWFPGPRFVNLYLIILKSSKGIIGPELARRAAGLLEARQGVLLDWAAGFRSSGAVWLLIKPWAREKKTMRRVRFRASAEDLAALRALLCGYSIRNRDYGPQREEERTRQSCRFHERE